MHGIQSSFFIRKLSYEKVVYNNPKTVEGDLRYFIKDKKDKIIYNSYLDERLSR